ncbi:hypothetical protein B0O99DRAFT_685352 [Bisporella sp. PMI_857]|nr:hypothetical protein B0O99DRAFT_685352 [Bisporella sp. PMI_857]
MSREKKLRRLFWTRKQARRLAASFDALSKIPGLFDAGMMITTLNKVMATKCYEEICHYNEKYILKVWVGFMMGIRKGLQRINKTTVKTVELRAPGVSTLDARFMEGQVGILHADQGKLVEIEQMHQRALQGYENV